MVNKKAPKRKNNKKNWRLTKQRLQILDFVRSNKIHPTAEAIHEGVKKIIPNISVGTVYRNLRFLRDHGLLKEFVINKVTHFEARVDSHVHFVCEECHGIEDVEDAKDIQMIREMQMIAEKSKFYIRSENYEIKGICKHCKMEQHPRKLTPELFCIACGHLNDDLKREEPVCTECKFQTDCAYVKV